MSHPKPGLLTGLPVMHRRQRHVVPRASLRTEPRPPAHAHAVRPALDKRSLYDIFHRELLGERSGVRSSIASPLPGITNVAPPASKFSPGHKGEDEERALVQEWRAMLVLLQLNWLPLRLPCSFPSLMNCMAPMRLMQDGKFDARRGESVIRQRLCRNAGVVIVS